MSRSESPPDILRVQQDDAEYQRMLLEEEAFWDEQAETLLTHETLPVVQAYLNERMTGDTNKRWFEAVGYEGPYRRGCVLGAGPGEVEEHLLDRSPDLRLTVLDISSQALARQAQRLSRFGERVMTLQQDLNFVELTPEAYDLIIANASLHHLVNLEHVAFQVNRALTEQGRFFMEDTVGESYFQFSDEKKRVFENLIAATRDSSEPPAWVDWPHRDNWQYSPFESVRSADILDVFARYLEPVAVRTSSSLTFLALFVRIAAPGKGPRSLLRGLYHSLIGRHAAIARGFAHGELLFYLDRLTCDTGRLLPGQAFASYRKRDG